MPASRPASCCDTHRAAFRPPPRAERRGAHRLASDAEAVSEVIGQILSFAIVAGVFLLSLLAFAKAQEGTQDRVIQLRSDSVADRVAAVAVQAGLLTEEQGTGLRVRFFVDLPQDLESRPYQVQILPPAGGAGASIKVTVPARLVVSTAPLLSIESGNVPVCAATVRGGHLNVRFGDPPGVTGSPCLFLEAAP